MIKNLRTLIFISTIAAAACSRAEDDLEVRGHVFDEAGRPVAGARIDFYWSANGTGRHADGTLLSLNSPENERIFWGNVGRMEPRRAEAGTSSADGSFCLTLPDFSHVIMAMDQERKRGGLFVIDRLRPEAAADIKLETLVRVHAQFEGPSADQEPYWTHAYVLTPEYAKRPLDSRRLAHCGSFDRRFEVALPPGKYVLDAYGQLTADEDIDLRVSPDREFIVTPGSEELDLGVLRLEPCTSLHRRIQAAKRNGAWGDYQQHYGEPPPQWRVTDARGVSADVHPSDFRGKWLLVEFWGLSCRVCLKDGLPRLVRFYEEHSAQRDKFEVLAFCIDHDGELKSIADVDRALEPIVENAWGGKELPFPMLLDSTLTTWERFGLEGLGTTILIDPDGKLVRGDEAALARILGETTKEAPKADTQTLRSAVARGLDVITKAAGRYPENETCFSCHHQTLPLLAAVTARDHGVPIDEKLLTAQKTFTHTSFHDELENLRQGRRIGGRAMTVGYGFWALRLAAAPADETTEAMAAYLLKLQHDDGHWSRQTSRPPLEDSNVACTTLAIFGLKNYAAESQRLTADAAIEKAARWLAEAKIESQDDRCFRLWSLTLLDAPAEQIEMARKTVLDAQREDGGWAQLDTMKSDAYAAGQTLWMLHATGFSPAEEAYQHGVKYLISTQCDDGSWLVRSRSKPVQPYFDNGDPHGKDQFISTPATCWAVAALAAAVK